MSKEYSFHPGFIASALIFGKMATAVYILTVSMAMLFNYLGYHSPVVTLCVYASLAITLFSGFHYIWHASKLLSERA